MYACSIHMYICSNIHIHTYIAVYLKDQNFLNEVAHPNYYHDGESCNCPGEGGPNVNL